MNAFFAALQFLTIFPYPRRTDAGTEELGRAAVFFPVIGFLLGAILVLVNGLFEPYAPSGLLSAMLVALLALMTGGLHLDGLGDTFDGLGAVGDRERVLQVMDDSHTGAFGLIAIVLLLFLKIESIESIESERWRALVAAPVLGRWGMVLLGYRSCAAKPGLGSILIERLKPNHVLLATFVTLILAAAVLHALAIFMMVWIGLFSLASRSYLNRRLGGLTGDTFGAVGELSETSVLLVLALGAR